jgi:hypothetical protein
MLRIGVEETVSISVFDVNGDVDIELDVQDFPNRKKTFSLVSGKFRQCTLSFRVNFSFVFFTFILQHLLMVFIVSL